MRFIKPIITLIILALIALFIWQNLPTFNAQQVFQLSLPLSQPMKWGFSIAFLLTTSLVIGLVVGILIMLKPYMGLRKKLAQEKRETPPQQG